MSQNRIDSLTEGLRHVAEITVQEQDLDSYWKIGQLEVMAIPVLIAFMEQSIIQLIQAHQSIQLESICLETNLKQMRPAHLGDKIHCNVYLKFIEENKLFFDVAVLNAEGDEIAIGSQERIVI